jgi:hypothetical protein
MLQSNCGPRLALKTNARSFIREQTLMQHLNCHRTVHRQVARAIHGAHAPGAQALLDAIFLIECLTDQ